MFYELAYKGMSEFFGETPEDCRRYFADNKYELDRVSLVPSDQGKHMKSPSGRTGWLWMVHIDGEPVEYYRVWECVPQAYKRDE